MSAESGDEDEAGEPVGVVACRLEAREREDEPRVDDRELREPVRQGERDRDGAAYGDGPHDLDAAQAKRGDPVRMLAYPGARAPREVPDAAEEQEGEQPREDEQRQGEDAGRDRAALALRPQRVVHLGREGGGVDVQRDVASRGGRVVVAERDDGRLADEDDRAARPAPPRVKAAAPGPRARCRARGSPYGRDPAPL